jgi:penicillin amidase
MDFWRRTAAGRLSEVIGASTLGIDKFMRTLGLADYAAWNLEALSPEVQAYLEAYAAGVNAHLEQRQGPLPPAFLLLGYEPEPWRPVDSVLWGRLMALQLSGNWRDELRRAAVEIRPGATSCGARRWKFASGPRRRPISGRATARRGR